MDEGPRGFRSKPLERRRTLVSTAEVGAVGAGTGWRDRNTIRGDGLGKGRRTEIGGRHTVPLSLGSEQRLSVGCTPHNTLLPNVGGSQEYNFGIGDCPTMNLHPGNPH